MDMTHIGRPKNHRSSFGVFRRFFLPPAIDKNLVKLRTVCANLTGSENVIIFRLDTV
jgi:hypothetical protein